uniref:Uncharacterized protein n=1 Tax=Trichogramma kaykai TaxID=54128 RepID=A0ABD2X6G5_9HYME
MLFVQRQLANNTDRNSNSTHSKQKTLPFRSAVQNITNCSSQQLGVFGAKYVVPSGLVATATLSYASLAPRAACALPSSPTRVVSPHATPCSHTLCSTANLNASLQIKISLVILTSLPLFAYLSLPLHSGMKQPLLITN